MACVLLVRNKYDPMTSYMHDWSEPFISECGKRGIKVDLIDEKEVIRSNLESRIRGVNYSFIFLNGHGDNSCFCGYEGKVVISLTKGSTIDQAIESSHKKATHEIIRILKNIDEPGSSQVLGAIISNDSVLGYEGDGNAKI